MKAVAPFTGAWIEILNAISTLGMPSVAPFTGAWIEIKKCYVAVANDLGVAPFTGAWIEIGSCQACPLDPHSRTLHGCVD